MTLKAPHVGEAGFVSFVHELRRLRVLSRREVLSWVALHGSVIRWADEAPLDDGSGLDEQAFADLQRDLGET